MKIYLSLLFAVFSVFTTSCIKEDMSDCGVAVRFAYTHNILSANALENKVEDITLYVFDEDGILAQQYNNGSTPLTNNFTMRLNNLTPGSYRFVTWAQSRHLISDYSYFSIPSLTIGTSTIDELTYLIKRESGVQQHELNNLLIGMEEVSISRNTDSITINLKKINKKIRVITSSNDPQSMLNVEEYEFSITDKVGNGHINYDGMLLPDEQITYLPYYAANIDKAAVVEISTSRLLETNAPHLRIIEKDGGKEVVYIDLPKTFSLTNMEGHREWSLQEYLDRQDRYTIMLYFSDNTWISDTIIINEWITNSNDLDI